MIHEADSVRHVDHRRPLEGAAILLPRNVAKAVNSFEMPGFLYHAPIVISISACAMRLERSANRMTIAPIGRASTAAASHA